MKWLTYSLTMLAFGLTGMASLAIAVNKSGGEAAWFIFLGSVGMATAISARYEYRQTVEKGN